MIILKVLSQAILFIQTSRKKYKSKQILKNCFEYKTRPFKKPPDNKVTLSVLEYYYRPKPDYIPLKQ